MIKPYRGAEAKKMVTASNPLPAGGYVAKILKAETGKYPSGNDYLDIFFDITEGEQTGFFKKQYDANTNEDKKWKGRYRINVPDENGQWFESQQRSFNGFIFDIEDSNPGFKWAWDETALKGKTVGVLFRDKEWEFNGNTGWTTECAFTAVAQDVRDGNFKQPKSKALAKKAPVYVEEETNAADDEFNFF